MKDNLIQSRSFAFAVRIVKLAQHLSRNKREQVISKQVLRSGTSIGANVEEALGASSKADFLHKITVAYKEARETCYWLRLLNETGYFLPHEFCSIFADAEELCRILSKIQTSTKGNDD